MFSPSDDGRLAEERLHLGEEVGAGRTRYWGPTGAAAAPRTSRARRSLRLAGEVPHDVAELPDDAGGSAAGVDSQADLGRSRAASNCGEVHAR